MKYPLWARLSTAKPGSHGRKKQWCLSRGHGVDDSASLRNRLRSGSKKLPQYPVTSFLRCFVSLCLASCLLSSTFVGSKQEESRKRSVLGLQLHLDLCKPSKAPCCTPSEVPPMDPPLKISGNLLFESFCHLSVFHIPQGSWQPRTI